MKDVVGAYGVVQAVIGREALPEIVHITNPPYRRRSTYTLRWVWAHSDGSALR